MPFYDILEASLRDIPAQLGQRPKAILMVSAHWEEKEFSIMSSAHPSMLYDYGGFPEHTYHIQYPAPGSPALAERVRGLLQSAGFSANLDGERGFDHGAFAPAFPMYPQADIPMVQLSIKHGYDPQEHFAMGRALAPLRDEGILILGSGLSYHNLRAMMRRDPLAKAASKAFDDWLQKTILHSTPQERFQSLLHWAEAPSARQVHPHEDHLVPLFVAAGAAENDSTALIYHEDAFMENISVSSFRFGGN
jgi:aromatic ring-opening dioxygenase catalytic subunit (LigB family)